MNEKIIEIKCREAYTRDVSRGIIRIDYDTMDNLNLTTGDIIEVEGITKTVGKCLPLYPSDEGKKMVRMDGLLRTNCGIAIDDTVKVRKVKAVPAEKITVTPLEAIPPIDEKYLAEALDSVPVVLKQRVMIPYFGGRLSFSIIDTVPKETPVIISRKTVFVINERGGEKSPLMYCKYCDKEIAKTTLKFPYCGIDHKIRWTIRDELKNMGIKEVKIE